MTRRALRPTALLLLAFAALAAAPAAAEDSAAKRLIDSVDAAKRVIDAKDLLQFHWLADPRISPDGSRVAFVRVGVDADGAGYETSLWWVPSDGSKPPAGPDPRHARRPAPLVAGRQPAGVRPRAAQGGEGHVAADLDPRPRRRRALAAHRPGARRRLSGLVARRTDPGLRAPRRPDDDVAQKAKPPEKPVKETDVTVTTRAVYRFNGGGTLDYARPDHLWTIGAARPWGEAGGGAAHHLRTLRRRQPKPGRATARASISPPRDRSRATTTPTRTKPGASRRPAASRCAWSRSAATWAP
jgi:dipeptidyl aminopeptidase/acylaminoacyl peptidase